MSGKNVFIRVACVTAALCMLAACGGPVNNGDADASSSAVSSKGVSSKSKKAKKEVNPVDLYNTPTEYDVYPGERDPWLWPFARNSIWNMPIGSEAEFKDTGMKMPGNYCFDHENHYKTTADDPKLEIVRFKTGRWSDNEADISTHTGDLLYFPKDAVIGITTNNECTTVLQPDGRTIRQLQPACRVNTESKYINGHSYPAVDLYSDGYYGTHFGSGLSAFGGTIRKGELTGTEDIHHALKINIWASEYLYQGVSYDGMGNFCYTWPARCCDSYATSGDYNQYGGVNPYLMMGSLLAIPGDVTMESLGLKTEPAKKLFKALQNYGCYIVDDVYWDAFAWSTEAGVEDEVLKKYKIELKAAVGKESSSIQRTYSDDMTKLFLSLKIVVNNTKDSIGGGGTPRVPLAPDLPVVD